MNPWILTIIGTIMPVLELRWGIPYAILNGINPLKAFLVCVFLNILIIPIIFFFLDYINKYLMRIKSWNRFFIYYLNKKIDKVKRKYEILSFFVLFLFVAIPFPGTGAYTGVLLAWFFKLDRKKSIITIALGVLSAGIITTMLTIFGISFFKLF